MDEAVFYITEGDPADKHSQESLGSISSIQTSHHFSSFRNADCPRYGAALTGMGPGERLFIAGKNKALITSYSWGKEGAEQRFPVPENMACLCVAHHPLTYSNDSKPLYSVPWLLVAGSKSGKLYVWEINSGNLVCVKDAHYQEISVIKVSKCGTFVFTGGLDSRVMVWRMLDLVGEDSTTAKPYASFTSHSLAVTDLLVSDSALVTDLRLYSASKDGTLRVYDVATKSLLTTFVFSVPVECIARDPAGRALYAGLNDGSIRQVQMYVVNQFTHVLEAIGGHGKIVTVESDPDLRHSFAHHQDGHSTPTTMAVSLDGMLLVSGDSTGRVFVSDVVTKQVVKSFTPCKSGIAYLEVGVHSTKTLNGESEFDKKHRLLPGLKRVLVSPDALEHVVTMQIAGEEEHEVDFQKWLQQKAEEELEFKLGQEEAVSSASREAELEEKLLKVSNAYTSLKTMYEELLAESNKTA